MAAEPETHRRQKLVRELRLTTRAEPLVKRRSQHRSRNGLIDPGLDRPPPLTRIRNSAAKLRQLRILDECRRRKIQQPRRNHTPAPPHLSHIRQVEVVLVVFRIAQRRSLSIDLRGMLADVGALQDTKPFRIGRHHPILNAVMHHLDEVPRAIAATVQIPLLRSPPNLLPPRSPRHIPHPRSNSPEDRIPIPPPPHPPPAPESAPHPPPPEQ